MDKHVDVVVVGAGPVGLLLAQCRAAWRNDHARHGRRRPCRRDRSSERSVRRHHWCVFTKWNPDYRSGMIGYCIDDKAWGHGFATEAAAAMSSTTG
jgi:hypothetical protein